ncbi:WD40-repeat-containing domain protein [Syncephalis plumigaleata]|nr:WD40-repeat-containing domain protein [Syncephalis plumigaleata]
MSTFQVGYAPELLRNAPYPLQHSCIIGNTVDNTDYVYDIQDMGDELLAITTSANHNIHLYDKTRLIPKAQLVYHQNSVRCMQRVRSASHLLLSCGDDGQVALWDLRQHGHTPSQIYSGAGQMALLSLDQTDTLIAVGTELVDYDAYVLFWDTRSGSMLKKFSEGHSDAITQVQFHPNNPQYLLTAAMDGMLNIYDLNETEEDDMVIASANTEASIHRADFFGPSFEYVYCLSHMETLSLWKGEDMDPLCLFGDVRRGSTDTATIDYVINCHYDTDAQRLFMLSGSNEGALHIHHVNMNQLQHCASFVAGGHTEIVRSVHWQPQSNYLVSGGEDGKLCVWQSNTP